MSLTLQESRARAALIDDVSYDIDLDLSSPVGFDCVTRIRFAAREPGAATFLELAAADGLRVVVNGVQRRGIYSGGRILLDDLALDNDVVVSARLPYVTDGEGMHTLVDSADAERYVSAYCSMDVAQRVFPCFDQPDLKARIALSVSTPTHWSVLANGRVAEREADEATARWSFTRTPVMPTYLFVVCCGPWASSTWERSVRTVDGHRTATFGWHARASQASQLERDAGELRRITDACFDHYQQVFTEPYPFDDYHQVFAPGLTWGAMETPGAITFRDELLFRGDPTPEQSLSRAETIAHEMAHMWFGDLATMRWWEDTWLNESFADYMGYAVAADAAGYDATWVDNALIRKPTAYRADRRRSTHPVAPAPEDVTDVDTALGNFDMITYAKGNAALNQLVVWLGQEAFTRGSDAYLTNHRFANADLSDFLDALDSVTDRDVRGWADRWLRTTGFDTIVVEDAGSGPVLRRQGSRRHRLGVSAYDDQWRLVHRQLIELGDEPVALPEWADRLVVPNSGEETYALVRLTPSTERSIAAGLSEIAEPLTRAMVWAHELERAESGDLSMTAVVDLVRDHLVGERHPIIFAGVLRQLSGRIAPRFANPEERPRLQAAVAMAAQAALDDAQARPLHRDAKSALVAASEDFDLLDSWLARDRVDHAPVLDPDLRWQIVRRLVASGRDVALIEAELERDPSTTGHQAALRARAASPFERAKADAWTAMVDGNLSGREFEATGRGLFEPGQHELVAPYLTRYLEAGPRWVAGHGQGFARSIDAVFPWLPLPDDVLTTFRHNLAAVLSAGLPTLLQRHWDDSLDDLDAVVAVRGLSSRTSS